jgi:hypothetical protein
MATAGVQQDSTVRMATGKHSLVSDLLKASQSQFQQRKHIGFVKKLEVLVPVPTHNKNHDAAGSNAVHLGRETINALANHDYVAVSYPWQPSPHESDICSRRYTVGGDASHEPEVSDLRDCVPDRVLNFMRLFGLRHVWIDRHCIRQNTECNGDGCRHRTCRDKKAAVQTMDYVYSLSKYSVAVLGRRIVSEDELELLALILSGQLVGETRGKRLLSAIDLLHEITSDTWWQRAWTSKRTTGRA